ncbi:hypothetical protein [Methanobrevibacter arboriphilus]|uniref:hypothetical protein n=1 Tax=Methanobrevibacter arboriphilus TaxID=39441 RepID=UPI000A6FBDC4|nr:hypothetical protein [Methanobrevibacter arboriphilus]
MSKSFDIIMAGLISGIVALTTSFFRSCWNCYRGSFRSYIISSALYIHKRTS